MSRSWIAMLVPAALVLLMTPLCRAAALQPTGTQDLLDTLRRIIREGDQVLGIPVLDPFTLSYYKASTDNAKGELSNVTVTGLGDFTAEVHNSIGILQIKEAIKAAVPKLLVTGDYAFDGVFQINGGDSHLYGAGPFEITLEDLTCNAEAVIGPGLSGLLLKSVDVELGLGDIKIDVHGLLWGGLVDDFLSSVVTELAGELFEEMRPNLEEALENKIAERVEEALDGVTWGELLCILFNQCGEELYEADQKLVI